jgi:hypothetical protein
VAVVALAGCAVAHPPARGSANRLAGSASSGTTVTTAQPAAKPALSPEQRAVADADAILASFVVPPGARKLASAPTVSGCSGMVLTIGAQRWPSLADDGSTGTQILTIAGLSWKLT